MATRHVVFAGAGLVGAAATVTSAVTLYDLAQTCGINGPFAAALPIALDAGAAVASTAWITQTGPVQSWGRGIAIGALIGTVAGNGVQHAIAENLLPLTLPLVLAVSASIPAMLWAVIHLVALMVGPERKQARAKTARATVKAESKPDAKPARSLEPTAPDEVQSRRGERTDRAAWLRDQPAMTWSEQVAAVEREFSVSRSTAKRVVSQVAS